VATVRFVLRLTEQDRAILRLAVPAFAALVCEPLFLLADAAVVGHLGTAPLAGLGIAGAFLTSVNGEELASLNQRHAVKPRHR